MKIFICVVSLFVATRGLVWAETPAPRFSTNYMDRSVDPALDFYRFACGTWLNENPVPADKARWAGFDQLAQRNWELLHGLLVTAAADESAPAHSPTREVGDFFASAMDTNRIEELGFEPLREDFARIDALSSSAEMMRLVAAFDLQNTGAMFGSSVGEDEKNSAVYALYFEQGGLGMPDRDYYLAPSFAKQRVAYVDHVTKMLAMTGTAQDAAKAGAEKILDLETALAKASKARADLRDPVANYHKLATSDAEEKYPNLALEGFFEASGISAPPELVVRQPEFLAALNELVKERPLEDWKIYLRWHVLRAAAPRLGAAAEAESFHFYGSVLSGQPAQEPRWQRSARTIDREIGEALGQLYVEKYFPARARAEMNDLIENLKGVFRGRLQNVEWMSEATRAKALTKFDRFSQKIGYPAKFRDYSSVEIRRDDYLGNVRRAASFESKRELARIGKPVDKSEWTMTPQTVNAYFNPPENEIVFPAGILQPPFFDPTMDDAVNYGAIGVVIGHEMTHGYDDEGRKYDADGNLNDWWTPADAAAFDGRAQKLVDQYDSYEALPGLHVNGKLTLGENIADLGGVGIAYEALEQDLAKNPEKRKQIEGFTPEQRFFISFAQIWRVNCREAETRRRITTDPHSPGQFRGVGPEANRQEFYDAFGIKEGAPMWRPPALRAIIW
ncbi:MAG TPA: M13 family metallopeptidase [Candidatus Saccharimonadales bacterium]|nr:M13 family metallopeptidase [Candidatus Saccharimonadales bacterium]